MDSTPHNPPMQRTGGEGILEIVCPSASAADRHHVMRRKLFNLAAALSLLLCVAVCVLWARSYGLTDQIVWNRADGVRSIGSSQGRVVLALHVSERVRSPYAYGFHHSREKSSPANFASVHVSIDPGSTHADWEGGGFEWYLYRPLANNYLIVRAVAPHWFFVTATAILPLVWSGLKVRARVRDHRRERLGLCHTCGYDLRCTPKGGRCPECGCASGGDTKPPHNPPLERTAAAV